MTVRTPNLQRPRLLLPTLATLAILVVLVLLASNYYTELLFFRAIGFSRVYTTVLGTRLLLFFVGGAVMSVIVGANLVLAYRLRPEYRPMSLEQQNLDRYRVVLEPRRRGVLGVLGGVVFLISGLALQGQWQTWLLYWNRTPFGVRDPQFHRDVSFYAFSYPFLRMLIGFGFAAVLVSLVGALAVHYLAGGIRLQTRTDRFIPAARGHISVLLAVFCLLKAVAYWYDRYGLMYSTRGIVYGASYTDVHIVLPAKSVLLFIALACAVLFGVGARARNWLLPGVSFALLLASALIIGVLVPTLVETFSVHPNAITKEAPYIQRNIDATLAAYHLNGKNLVQQGYSGNGSASGLASDTGAQAAARLLDPNVLSPTYQQLQQERSYFGFSGSLDIDRYAASGAGGSACPSTGASTTGTLPTTASGISDQVVAVRELNLAGLQANQQNWINEHLVFTHGNGFVSAPANQVDSHGNPVFDESGIPPCGFLNLTDPQVYFGEQSPPYSIVHTKQAEVDGPGSPGSSADSTSSYHGSGGVSVGSEARKILYALKFKDPNFLLSSALTSQSRILYYRDPRTRVSKAAPWLTLDSDPYPAVVDGHITWIVDGYTTSDGFPYAQRTNLNDVTADSVNSGLSTSPTVSSQINYIRNSVKATVDAYTGAVTLYAFDPTDPVLRTWMKVFPGTVKPLASASAALQAHFRYPEDMFKVQRSLLSRYHVTDPRQFYEGSNQWSVPADPSTNSGALQPPFYLRLQVPGDAKNPGQASTSFDLTSTYNPAGRPNLAAFISVSSEPADYGQVRILNLPTGTSVQGVGQIEAGWQGDSVISKDITLFDQGGSHVRLGNLLAVPAGGGLLYVQPLYVQASAGEQYPHLQRVIVSYDGQTGYCPTLSQAIATVVANSATVDACPTTATTPTAPTPTPPGTTPPPLSGGTVSPQLAAAINAVLAAFNQSKIDFAAGNFAAYGQDLAAEQAALKTLQSLQGASTATGTPAPSAGPTGSPSPSTGSGSTTPSPATATPSVPASSGSPVAAGPLRRSW